MHYEFCTNVIVEDKNPSKVYLRNIETGKHTALKDKTKIAIILELNKNKQASVEQIANNLNIDQSRIKSLFRDLAKRNFLFDNSKAYELFD